MIAASSYSRASQGPDAPRVARHRAAPPALVALALAVAASSPATAAVVYDNTTSYVNAENTLLSAGQTDSGEHGSEVTLAGTERSVTGITIMLRIHGAAPATFDLRVRFYENDGSGGRPGTLLWESPLLHRVIDSGAPLPYSIAVPNILVPDTFTWTVQVTNRQGNTARMGPSEYNPPAIGSAPFGFWRRTAEPESWELTGLDEAPFGARLTADAGTAPVGGETPAPPLTLRVRPNPVLDRAEFTIGHPGPGALLEIYDLSGRLVDRLAARTPTVVWTPPDRLRRGAYFARLIGPGRATLTFAVLR